MIFIYISKKKFKKKVAPFLQRELPSLRWVYDPRREWLILQELPPKLGEFLERIRPLREAVDDGNVPF